MNLSKNNNSVANNSYPTQHKTKLKSEKITEETPQENETEDYDFNFDIYKTEEKEETNVDSVKNLKKNKPNITNLRSKFNNSLQMLEILLRLREKIITYGIKVGSNTSELDSLWKFYGCLNEYWANIKDMFGILITEEIEEKQKKCMDLLNKYTANNIQNFIVNKALLELRSDIYMVSQRANLGLEVEKIYSSRNNAQKGIVE